MSDGRWGVDEWGATQWGGGAGVAHSMSARVGIVGDAVVSRLGPRHSLEATATVRSRTYGIGAGPAAIHPLRASASVLGGAFADALQTTHELAATARILSNVLAAPLSMRHPLRASVEIDSTAVGWLSIRHPLRARARLTSTALANGLRMNHRLRGVARLYGDAWAVYTLEVPAILAPNQLSSNPDAVLPGVLNLASNPIAAMGLQDWAAYAYATVELDDAFSWDGDRSVKVTPGSVGSGVQVTTRYPLGLPTLAGSVVWGQAMLALNLPPPSPDPVDRFPMWVNGWVEVQYSDGSTDAGEPDGPFPILGSGYQADWDIFVTSLVPDPDKVATRAWLTIVRDATPSTPTAFWVGGVQLEYDRWQVGPRQVRRDGALLQTRLKQTRAT